MQHDVQEFSRILQDKLEIKMKVSKEELIEAVFNALHRALQQKEPFPGYSRDL